MDYKTFRNSDQSTYNPWTIYVPAQLAGFSKEWNIQFKMNPQITLLKNNHVIYSKTGELTATDFFEIRKCLLEKKNNRH